MNRPFMITDDDRIAIQGEGSFGGSAEGITFASEEELQSLLQDWPLRRLIELWNRIPGVRSVMKFENRATAVGRLWRAIQPPDPQIEKHNQPSRTSRRRRPLALPREDSKAARVLALLRQPQGATLDQIMAATEWQAHSVRGFISGNLVAKRGLKVRSRRLDGKRVYHVHA